jgi:Holliday junction resolvasome RuvABC DNA-binding subunit
MNTLNERMKRDMEILCSMKGIGENTATNFLIEMGGAVENEPPCCKQQGIRGKRPVLKEPCFTL